MAHPPRTLDAGSTRPPLGRRIRLAVLLLVLAGLFGAGTVVWYYVEGLWFGSLGYGDVFWRTVGIQGAIFGAAFAGTFAALYGAFLALKPTRFGELGSDGVVIINGQAVSLPVGPVLHAIALAGSLLVALVTAASLVSAWPELALWWSAASSGAGASAAGAAADPIFGRPIAFYLFTLPAWRLIADWFTTLAVAACAMALFFVVASGGARRLTRFPSASPPAGLRGLGLAWAVLLLALAAQVYLGRFERLFDDHTIFAGVTYTEAHVTLIGAVVVTWALVAGAAISAVGAFAAPGLRWLLLAALPALVLRVGFGLAGGYVNSFIVKPNELVRETPYIAHNIEFTRQAFGLHRIAQRSFPAEATVAAANPEGNAATLQNIRLWDWRALQDTLRQLQEIRTYYDFPDIDIDRYTIGGSLRQVMLAARELSIEKLPESSRNWINEKLIYTHGYGLTMNGVNGFTPEGLPDLLLKDMPVQSAAPGLSVTRPEIYYGEMTNADVYVRTRQQEFNYPQGQTNSLTSYDGSGGIPIGNWARRLLLAMDRGDLGKLPFSDDVTSESRLLMRRNVRERVTALAPFLTFDDDPYVVLDDGGRLWWILDGFTTTDRYPYSRPYVLGTRRVNYVRNSVKAVVDAYNGTTTLYVFDAEDPIVDAWRGVFPSLFRDAASMPSDLRKHVRYPEALLALQADVFGLYHMTSPEVFYNREDLWTVASAVSATNQRDRASEPMEPNFVLMTLPGESATEFVEVLPFTPSNRNNLIGWIAGRSDGDHYGDALVYDFPKTRLVDGPLQIEARIDQDAQLSGQLALWNQQGSRVRRGALIVIPIGRALLYAEAIYLQAERSPMPELRLVVLAMQDRLVYAPTFEGALAALFGGPQPAAAAARARGQGESPSASAAAAPAPAPGSGDLAALIGVAAQDLADYQRLTAEGRLAEAGQKLEHLKQTLDLLNARRR